MDKNTRNAVHFQVRRGIAGVTYQAHECANDAECFNAQVLRDADTDAEQLQYQCACQPGFTGETCLIVSFTFECFHNKTNTGRRTPLERTAYTHSSAYSRLSPSCVRCRVYNSTDGSKEQESNKVRGAFFNLYTNKTSFRGQYSPSRQEMTTARQHQMAYILKPPPQEGLI